MTKNPLISLFLVCAIIVGGYFLYQVFSSEATTIESEKVDIQESQNSKSPIPDTQKSTASTTNNSPQAKTASNEGIHIMPDGTVMAKDGSKVDGATILQNGTIKLQNGTIVTPAVDMRAKTGTDKTDSSVSKPAHVVIDIVGTDFAYDIKQIKVKKGDTVTINFISEGGFHDWALDEFRAFTDRVNEGEGVTSVTFVADKVGTFQYYCSVMSHRQQGMVGYLVVSER
jgi:plastocyanin